MKNIVVTGGAGFVGSHLCERLLNEGNKVYCIDNLCTGSKKNIASLLKNKKFIFIKQNIINPLELCFGIDEIYNLACPASPPQYQKDPIFTWKTNVIGTVNTINLAEKNKAKILHASTSEVYGDPLVHPQKENYWGNVNPVGIRSCYDEGKRAAETILMDSHRKNKTDVKIIRIFNTYGPRMNANDGRVVSNFIVQALQEKNLTVYGNGKQTRSFCYVSDLIDGMIKMMDSELTGPVNFGNPGEFTVLELAEKVLKMTNSKSKIIYKPLPQDDPTRRKPDISLAKEKLKWEPKVALDSGLKQTIAYFNSKTL